MSKLRKFLSLTVICLAMWAIMAAVNIPTSKTVSARAQQPAYLKTGALIDVETILSRIFPFYRRDSWLNVSRNDLDARHSLLKPGSPGKLIIPTQEPDKTSVPFKGWITKGDNVDWWRVHQGKVSLILKIYDQSNGGTKLYEGTHEVEVTYGQYFAIIQVPSEIIAKSQTIWLEATSAEARELAFEPRQPFTTKPPEGVVPNVAVPTARFCYTCGSYWFVLEGAIPVPSGNPTEYGPGCAGPVQVRTDYRPYLCAVYVAK